jgi:hypothetical protein
MTDEKAPEERIIALRSAIESLFSLESIRTNPEFTSMLCPRMMIGAQQLLTLPAVQACTADVADVVSAAKLSKVLHKEECSSGGWNIGLLPYSSLRSRCSVVVACQCPDFTVEDLKQFVSEEILFHAYNLENSTGSLTGGGASGPLHLTFVDDKIAKKVLLELQRTTVRGHAVTSRLRIYSVPATVAAAERAAEAAVGSESSSHRHASGARSVPQGPTRGGLATPAAPSVAFGPSASASPSLLAVQQKQMMQAACMGLMNPIAMASMAASWSMMMGNQQAMLAASVAMMAANPRAVPNPMLDTSAPSVNIGGLAIGTPPGAMTSVRVTPNYAALERAQEQHADYGVPCAPEAVTVTDSELVQHQPMVYRRNPYSRCSPVIRVSPSTGHAVPQVNHLDEGYFPKGVPSDNSSRMAVTPIDDLSVGPQRGSQPYSSGGSHRLPIAAASSQADLHQELAPHLGSSNNSAPAKCHWQAQRNQQQKPRRSRTPPLPKMDFPTLPCTPSSSTPSSASDGGDTTSMLVNSSSENQRVCKSGGSSSAGSPAASPTFAEIAARLRN